MKNGVDIVELKDIKCKIEAVIKDIDALIHRIEKETHDSSISKKSEADPIVIPKVELKPPVPPAVSQPAQPLTAPLATANTATPVVGNEKREGTVPSLQGDNQEASQNKKLENAIYELLKSKNEPMSFEEIYSELEKSKIPLPAEKPKLVVRKILYNPKRFTTVKGMFKIV